VGGHCKPPPMAFGAKPQENHRTLTSSTPISSILAHLGFWHPSLRSARWGIRPPN